MSVSLNSAFNRQLSQESLMNFIVEANNVTSTNSIYSRRSSIPSSVGQSHISDSIHLFKTKPMIIERHFKIRSQEQTNFINQASMLIKKQNHLIKEKEQNQFDSQAKELNETIIADEKIMGKKAKDNDKKLSFDEQDPYAISIQYNQQTTTLPRILKSNLRQSISQIQQTKTQQQLYQQQQQQQKNQVKNGKIFDNTDYLQSSNTIDQQPSTKLEYDSTFQFQNSLTQQQMNNQLKVMGRDILENTMVTTANLNKKQAEFSFEQSKIITNQLDSMEQEPKYPHNQTVSMNDSLSFSKSNILDQEEYGGENQNGTSQLPFTLPQNANLQQKKPGIKHKKLKAILDSSYNLPPLQIKNNKSYQFQFKNKSQSMGYLALTKKPIKNLIQIQTQEQQSPMHFNVIDHADQAQPNKLDLNQLTNVTSPSSSSKIFQQQKRLSSLPSAFIQCQDDQIGRSDNKVNNIEIIETPSEKVNPIDSFVLPKMQKNQKHQTGLSISRTSLKKSSSKSQSQLIENERPSQTMNRASDLESTLLRDILQQKALQDSHIAEDKILTFLKVQYKFRNKSQEQGQLQQQQQQQTLRVKQAKNGLSDALILGYLKSMKEKFVSKECTCYEDETRMHTEAAQKLKRLSLLGAQGLASMDNFLTLGGLVKNMIALAEEGPTYKEAQARLMKLQAKIMIQFKEFLGAKELLKKLVGMCEIYELHDVRMRVYCYLAQVLVQMKHYTQALGCQVKMLQLAWLLRDTQSEILAYDLLGVTYFYLEETEKARFYHEKCMEGRIEEETSIARQDGMIKAMQNQYLENMKQHINGISQQQQGLFQQQDTLKLGDPDYNEAQNLYCKINTYRVKVSHDQFAQDQIKEKKEFNIFLAQTALFRHLQNNAMLDHFFDQSHILPSGSSLLTRAQYEKQKRDEQIANLFKRKKAHEEKLQLQTVILNKASNIFAHASNNRNILNFQTQVSDNVCQKARSSSQSIDCEKYGLTGRINKRARIKIGNYLDKLVKNVDIAICKMQILFDKTIFYYPPPLEMIELQNQLKRGIGNDNDNEHPQRLRQGKSYQLHQLFKQSLNYK